MFMLAEYVNMTTVSALAATLFLGGWRAPLPFSLIPGADSGWWALLWFVIKVWGFLFVFMWLRATLPRLRYDQFMAFGWKVLIPVSLAWVMVVATIRIALGPESDLLTPAMVVAGLLAVAVLVVVRRVMSRRGAAPDAPRPGRARSALEAATAGAAPSGTAPFDPTAGGFPVPPLPHQRAALDAGRTATTEEARHA